MRLSFLPAQILTTLLTLATPATAWSQATDTLRGHVTTDSGTVIAGAEVIATRAPDRAFKSALTDSAGNYQIVFAPGTGDYLLHASALGRETVRVRVKRAGTETMLVHDFQLKSAVQELQAITVEAKTDKPEREHTIPTPDPGDASHNVDGVLAGIPPDLKGDIAAAAATVPGVLSTTAGISVLGLDPSQNRTTVNGMSFQGATLPRSVTTYSRVSSSTYDPSRGWFSGAAVDVNIASGNLDTSMPLSLTFDSPLLQYGDKTSSALGQKFSNVILDIGRSGTIWHDKVTYSAAIDGAHRTSDFAALDRAGSDLLQQAGVASDSASRLLDVLRTIGIPFSSSAPTQRASDNLTFVGRIDHRRYNIPTGNPEKSTWGFLGYAKLGRQSLLGITPTALSSHAAEDNQRILSGMAEYSSFFHHNDFLTEAKTSLSVRTDRTNPYVLLPDGRVLVSSNFPDAAGATTSLGFGGGGSFARDTRDWTWETLSTTRFYASKRTHHRVQLTADSRIDGTGQSSLGNGYGTFSYNSLADIAANAPSSFTRTLNAPRSSASEWNAFASIGDYWRKSQTFQLMAGARLEANRFLDRPPYNAQLDQVLGVRNDEIPASVHVSPRLGFTYVLKPSSEGVAYSQMGSFSMGHISYLRGGIGEFRNMLQPGALSQPLIASGLPGGAQYLTCIGDATPIPDWSAYATDPAAIPTECANANAAVSPLADTARTISLLDPSYQPPRSWRGNLAFASNIGPLLYSIEGIYSLNLDQPGRVDLNLDRTPRFVTNEGRPVLVSPGSIVPSSGLVSSVEARRSALFGPVIANGSDLRSISRQLTVTLAPRPEFAGAWYMSLAYTLASVRALASGFDAPAFNSPFEREWARGDLDARHRIQLQAGKTIKRVTMTLFGTFQSGLPFTPLVGGDVNGDGLFNDRAFIFDPAAAPDAAVGDALRTLLASSSKRTRDCLLGQRGMPARRTSCEGPWTASLNARIGTSFNMSNYRYVAISLALTNPLGGLDQLLHGSSHLRGWGTQAFPDPILYNVRGFDPTSRSFLYEVNPRFGRTDPSLNVFRSPFRVTLDISTNIGPSLPLQQLKRLVLAGRGGRPGPRLTAADLKRRYSRGVPDPYAPLLEESDSLLLTEAQEKSIETAQQDYLRGIDSVWTGLADYLVALGDTFDEAEAVKRQEQANDDAWEYARQHVQKTLPSILSPIQLNLLPFPASFLFSAKKPVHVRIFSR
jgi:carboxypeptidase family protein